MAVKLNDGTVQSLHASLSNVAIFDVVNVTIKFLNVSCVGTGFPVILCDLISVVSDLMGVIINLFLGPLNSLDELCKNDSSSFDSDDLIGVDVDLNLIANWVNRWLVNVPVINGVSIACGCNWSITTVVVVCKNGTKKRSKCESFHSTK